MSKEGAKELEEERTKILEQHIQGDQWNSSKYRIKIRWKAAKNDESNGGYTKDMLLKFLSKVK